MKTSKSAKSVSPALVLTLQERVLTAIRDAARAAKCDVMEVSKPWSNIGVWHFQTPGTFSVVAAMRFDFQDGSFTLDLKRGAPASWAFSGGVRIPHHMVGIEFPKFLDSLRAMLTAMPALKPAPVVVPVRSSSHPTLNDLTVSFTSAQRDLIVEAINACGSGQHPVASDTNVGGFTVEYVRQCVREMREHVNMKGLRLIDAIEDRLGFTK